MEILVQKKCIFWFVLYITKHDAKKNINVFTEFRKLN
jgi:hypothetical protein